ncbi:MAG: cell division protein FtsZ, partial [Cyclobacteriaceae bacterium]|nr:cell division protein FtsZ [Cyclobacteriaceae bacterium]
GVGGGGSNAVNHMYSQGIKDVEFVVCNTDSQALRTSVVPNKLQIGINLTLGLGAGANPEKGKNAAIENKEEIRDLLGDETKMLFITAGMGGGTGTGAAPVIARIAKEMDILTVGIVTSPFSFEGKKKVLHAEEGIQELRDACDTVLVILNDQLREIYGNLSIGSAFSQADDVLTTAAKGIAEIITVAGYVNVDFEDVRTVMKNAGAAVMGSSETSGEGRARRAAEEALSSPLLDNKEIHGAKNILLSIISGDKEELQMDELTEITEFIQEKAGDDAEVIFGHGVDPELEDRIRVTVIATGFDPKKKEQASNTPAANQKEVFDLEATKQYGLFEMDNTVNESIGDISLKTIENDEPVIKDIHDELLVQNSNHYTEKNSMQEEEDDFFNDEDDGLFNELEDDFEFIDEDEDDDFQINKKEESQHEMEVSNTQERLKKQALDRINQLKAMADRGMSANDFKERLDVPAYLRKSVKLENAPHSSDANISKYHLNEENRILGNNKFLHDNVD